MLNNDLASSGGFETMKVAIEKWEHQSAQKKADHSGISKALVLKVALAASSFCLLWFFRGRSSTKLG
jgi:hypothetical protein